MATFYMNLLISPNQSIETSLQISNKLSCQKEYLLRKPITDKG